MRRAARWSAIGLVVATASVVTWSELVHARASRRRLGPPRAAESGCEVVVAFGIRNRAAHANLLNRYRVRVALRSRDATAERSRLVFTGGSTSIGMPPEAELMAEYAQTLGVHRDEIELETDSRTTWENVSFVTPMLEGADRIKFASNSLHAEKARAYLWRQRPDLAEHLVAADDYRFGELVAIKPILAWIGLRNLRGPGAKAPSVWPVGS